MTECWLCQEPCGGVDKFGLCIRVDEAHRAVRDPEEYSPDAHPVLWAAIRAGRAVYPKIVGPVEVWSHLQPIEGEPEGCRDCRRPLLAARSRALGTCAACRASKYMKEIA